jgi:HEAT repeat protein
MSIALALWARPEQSLAKSFAEMGSPDSSVRIAAFYELFQPRLGLAVNAEEATLTLLRNHPRDHEIIAKALISLLVLENSRISRAASGSLSEVYGDYHASLIWSVATLRDSRATDALLGAIKTGKLAADGLVALGPAAIPAVVDAVDSLDPDISVGATMVLGEMALQRDSLRIDAAGMEVIRSTLLDAAEDEDYSVRWAAVLSLAPYVDAGVRAAIQRAATLDTSERVREVAVEWLRNHQPE